MNKASRVIDYLEHILIAIQRIQRYDKVDFEMVWRTVRNDLPTLHAQIKSALTLHNGP
jgi:uncharacterized protein with HEPN domain